MIIQNALDRASAKCPILALICRAKILEVNDGEDAGPVLQGSAVRAPPQEIFQSNSGIAVLQ